MTSNMGARDLKNNSFGFGSSKNGQEYLKMKEKILGHVKNTFSPELVNRIDDSIVFHQLSESNVYDIIDLQIVDLEQNLLKLGLKLKLHKSAKKYIANKGYDQRYGVRLLRREIQKLLEDPISEMLLKNTYPKGTVIIIKLQKNQIIFDFKEIKKSSRKVN